MKLEFGLSVFSKRETLLGIELTTHNGIVASEDALYEQRVVEFSISANGIFLRSIKYVDR